MNFAEIKDQIATSLNHDCAEIWWGILDNTDPAHYGIEDLEVQLETRDIWLGIPISEGNFTFRNASLSFSAQLGASNPDDAIVKDCRKTVSGVGTFVFENPGRIRVNHFRINEGIDLFEHEPAYSNC